MRPLVVAALCLAGCGSAADGAALVHGELFAGTPRATSLEFTGRAQVHGAAPFRVVVHREPPGDTLGRELRPAGLSLVLTHRKLPVGGESLPVGGEDQVQAEVRWVPAGPDAPAATVDGKDTLYEDGGFVARAVGGTLQLELDGRNPGDGARGSFSLEFQDGSRASGTFAATLAD